MMSLTANKSCVTLNTNQSTTNWTINSTTKPINAMSMIYPPLILYTDWDITEDNSTLTYYQFCGPLIVLLREFAKQINTEFIINQIWKEWANNALEVMNLIVTEGEYPPIMMLPIFPLYIMSGLLNEETKLTQFIGGMDAEVILSKTRIIERSLFSVLNCWDHYIYLGLFLSILSMSLTIGLKEKSFSGIFEAIWDYFSVFLSDSYVLKSRTIKTRSLAIIWLLVNTILLSIYSGELYEIVIKGQLIDKIEVKEDLVAKDNWKDSKVMLFEISFVDYILSGSELNDPVALNLAKRINMQDPFEVYFNETVIKEIMSEVLNNNEVIIANKLLIYHIMRRAQNNWPQLMDNYIEGIDFHISKPERSAGCYFLVVDEDKIDLDSFNIIITRLHESGIYEYEVLKAVTPNGYGPIIDQERNSIFRLRPIALDVTKDIFHLSLFGLCLSFIVFIIELFFQKKFQIFNYLFNVRLKSHLG